MESSLDLLVWRSSLSRAADAPGIHEQLRAAAMCEAAGLPAAARMLCGAAHLRQGFSPQAIARRAAMAGEVGWALPAPAADRADGAVGTLEIAIGELERFAGAMSGRLAAALAAGGEAANQGGAAPAPPSAAGDLAELVDELHAFLAEPPPAAGWNAADALMARIYETSRRAAGFDYRAFAAAPLPLLAAAIGFAGVQDFVLRNHNLLFAPLGSAEFLHRTARFDQAGIGPYFTNVPRLAGRSRDVFALADLAHRAGGGDVPTVQWVVLLSQHLTGSLRNEVVDDLGDLGATAALGAVLDRAARQPDHRIELDLLMRLRDAALDNADYDLGARAQALVVRLRPDNLLERQILGSIDATCGRVAAAEQSFLGCLRQHPNDRGTIDRLVALRAGRFELFAVRLGFGTPKSRQLTRLRRREGAPAGPRVERRRAAAVEL